ncbi:putative cytochrome P450 [Bimuria novae-zelandiae CBS 107.79]|uniref:Putative cytochrome P450 n=1 Tax=Bimuria novae-zelandiae CBS 107.79 TaxID=1447943 RepID=A0A6A5VRV6_9PLEO|nr:putative cytochrome P450 [Bimuria novae-zelandiae CBS 107.79]
MALSTWADALQQNPNAKTVLTAFVVVAALAFTYRLLTTSQANSQLPVWAPLEIGLTRHLLPRRGRGYRLLSALRRKDGSLFGLTSKHQMLIDPPQVDRLMAHSASSISSAPVQYTIATRVFGCTHSPAVEEQFYASCEELTAPVGKLFLNDAAATAALGRADIPQQVQSFVSFSSDPEHMKLWERSANLKVTTTADGVQKVEADFQSLVRDFGACIAIPQLYGRDFLERYPQVLSDLWKFDNDLFPLMMIGIPRWAPLKIVKDGVAAQSRIHAGLEGLYRRVGQYQKGQPIDFDADMSDISDVVVSRHNTYEKYGWPIRQQGELELGLLWGQNANTQPVVFWLLTYVYSKPDLLKQLREETSPYLTMSETTPRELVALDIAGVGKGCQLLKACVFETYRLVNDVTSLRHVSRPITHTEGGLKHELAANTFLSALLSLANHDPSVYSDPESFDPTRFLEQSASTGKPAARYGKLKPWGAGAAMCKGRTFAEKEIMSLAVAIMSMWDIAPASSKWELPERVPGTGVQKPVKDIRVVITRRQ